MESPRENRSRAATQYLPASVYRQRELRGREQEQQQALISQFLSDEVFSSW